MSDENLHNRAHLEYTLEMINDVKYAKPRFR